MCKAVVVLCLCADLVKVVVGNPNLMAPLSPTHIKADVPTRKPRLPYRNSKARTKLSPLLENSCSPISKAEFPPPAHLSLSTPLREHHANGGLSGVPPTSRLSQSLGQPSNGHRAFQSHHHELIIPGGGVGGAVKPLHSSALIQSSPVSSQLNRTGHIQSVPPWYIFPTNKPESKVQGCVVFVRRGRVRVVG